MGEGVVVDEGEDLALISLTSSLAVTSPPWVDRIRVAVGVEKDQKTGHLVLHFYLRF